MEIRKIVLFSSSVLMVFSLASCGKSPEEKATTENVPVATTVTDIVPDGSVDESVMEGSSANDAIYDPDQCEMHSSVLKDKVIYWLGSSVTYGASSEGNSMADYLAAQTGCVSRKEAVSGTTLLTRSGNTTSYTYRLVHGSEFDVNEKIDAFVCQISTNDARSENLNARGTLTDVNDIDPSSFDLSKTMGGVEYIITYVKEHWDCPIFFYSGAYFGDSGTRSSTNPTGTNYGKLVEEVKGAIEKYNEWDGFDIHLIDLFNDEEFNGRVSDTYYKWATGDAIHPHKDGYRQWWTPYFEEKISEVLA